MSPTAALVYIDANKTTSLYPYLSWPYKKIEETLKKHEEGSVKKEMKDEVPGVVVGEETGEGKQHDALVTRRTKPHGDADETDI